MTIPAEAYGRPGRTASWKTITRPRCVCGRTLAEYLTPPFSLRCPRCKKVNRIPERPSTS